MSRAFIAIAIATLSLVASPSVARAGACGPNTTIPEWMIPYMPGFEEGCQIHDDCLDGYLGCKTVGECHDARNAAWANFCITLSPSPELFGACIGVAALMAEASDHFTCSQWAPSIPGQGCGAGDPVKSACDGEDINLCAPCAEPGYTQDASCNCACVVNGTPVFVSATCGWKQDPCGAWFYFGECGPCGDQDHDCYDDCTDTYTCQACGDNNYDCYDDCNSSWTCSACGDSDYNCYDDCDGSFSCYPCGDGDNDCYDDCSYDYTCTTSQECSTRPYGCPMCMYCLYFGMCST